MNKLHSFELRPSEQYETMTPGETHMLLDSWYNSAHKTEYTTAELEDLAAAIAAYLAAKPVPEPMAVTVKVGRPGTGVKMIIDWPDGEAKPGRYEGVIRKTGGQS